MPTYKVGSTAVGGMCLVRGFFDGDETWTSQLSFMGDYLVKNSGGCVMEVVVVQ